MDEKKKERLRNLKELGYYSSLGLSVSLAIFIGLFLGVWLDKVFDKPWLILVGLGLGIAAGFKNLIRAMNKSKKL